MSVDDDNRATVLDVAANTGASIVDVNRHLGDGHAGWHPERVQPTWNEKLERFSDVALQRTGRVALPRLGQTARAKTEEKV